ncbi:MAG: hypothetical protein IJU93_02240 [Lachnospiraceae bacterium]|nr:hypothetical protein [Lachnospiraceae bacterium]
MKKFVLKCVIFFCIIAAIFAPFGLFVDPYNIFHWRHIRNNGVEPNKSYVKMSNVLAHPEAFDSFIFGSSRVGFFDVSRLSDGKYYDMSYSEGTPAEHLDDLKIMINHGIIPKNVTIGVDDISYFVDPALHDTQLYRKRFPFEGSFTDKCGFYLKYFDMITLSQSLHVIRNFKDKDPDYGKRLLATGTERLDIESHFNYENTTPTWSDYYQPREEVYEDIRRIKELCKEYGINLRIFTNPVNGYTYAKGIANGYLEFLEGLAEVTDYYNFSGFNEITLNNDNYYETSHFNPKVSNMMIDRIYNERIDKALHEQGFGVYVTKDNVGELMDILYGQAVNYDLPVNTFPDVIH